MQPITTTLLALFLTGMSYAQNDTERYQPTISTTNSLENPDSYAQFDHYKVAKAKNALVYGRDYVFSGIPASDVDQALIDQVDPYSYLHSFKDYEDVVIPIDELGLTLVLYARKVQRSITISEND